jgi:hypothetical protein
LRLFKNPTFLFIAKIRFVSISFSLSHSHTLTLTFNDKGSLINLPYFGAKLKPNEMFRDDLWWEIGVENESHPVIEVRSNPNNPMVLKAQQVFQEALRK